MVKFPETLKELKEQVRTRSLIIGNDQLRQRAKVEENNPDLDGWIRLWLASCNTDGSAKVLSSLIDGE